MWHGIGLLAARHQCSEAHAIRAQQTVHSGQAGVVLSGQGTLRSAVPSLVPSLFWSSGAICLQPLRDRQYTVHKWQVAGSGHLTHVRLPSLAASLFWSSAATFSQSLRDRQYTIPHCGRPCVQNWRQMRSTISPIASSNLAFFLTTSYLQCTCCFRTCLGTPQDSGASHAPSPFWPCCHQIGSEKASKSHQKHSVSGARRHTAGWCG